MTTDNILSPGSSCIRQNIAIQNMQSCFYKKFIFHFAEGIT